MGTGNFVFTSESVSEGHPDKVADQISDAILDAHLRVDPLSRVACETLVKNDTVIIAGEITSNGSVNYEKVIRDVIRRIGYVRDVAAANLARQRDYRLAFVLPDTDATPDEIIARFDADETLS